MHIQQHAMMCAQHQMTQVCGVVDAPLFNILSLIYEVNGLHVLHVGHCFETLLLWQQQLNLFKDSSFLVPQDDLYF